MNREGTLSLCYISITEIIKYMYKIKTFESFASWPFEKKLRLALIPCFKYLVLRTFDSIYDYDEPVNQKITLVPNLLIVIDIYIYIYIYIYKID